MADQSKTDEFTDFVTAVEPKLRRAFTGSLGSEKGREAAAEALAYGWEHWDRISAMENPAGYLYRVGVNNGHKPRRRARASLPPVPAERLPWVEPELPAAMARLPERQRLAVYLVYGHDWSLTEVADFLGVSKGTVQKHVERGIARLRRRLGVE